MRRFFGLTGIVVPVVAAIAAVGAGIATPKAQTPPGEDARKAASLDAFRQMGPVLQHPRCLNCHTRSNHPTQGESGKRHTFGVARGVDDKGAAGMQCLSCHQGQNNVTSRAPGAEHWQLAPLSMGWEGKSLPEICRALTDVTNNGGRDAAALAKHMREDPLVQWAWSPGEARSTPPVGQQAFHALVTQWANTGGACPEE
jgi:hypothetical protein